MKPCLKCKKQLVYENNTMAQGDHENLHIRVPSSTSQYAEARGIERLYGGEGTPYFGAKLAENLVGLYLFVQERNQCNESVAEELLAIKGTLKVFTEAFPAYKTESENCADGIAYVPDPMLLRLVDEIIEEQEDIVDAS